MTPDRRRFRYVVKPRPFIAMKGSGGILRDVSDDGLAIDVVGPSLTSKRVHLNFDISETGEHFEGLGEIIWKNETGSKVGVRFVDLPDASRRKVRNWLATKSDSFVRLKNVEIQDRGTATNVEAPLWMRPRAGALGAAAIPELPEKTEPAVSAFNNRPSVESEIKPALSTRYTSVVPPSFETSAWLRPLTESATTSVVLESPEKVKPSVLPAGSSSTLEREFKPFSSPHHTSLAVPNFETSTSLRPLMESSATSVVLESPEKVEPSVLSAGRTWTSETEFKPVSSPHYTSVAVPNFETSARLRPLTENSAISAVLESSEKVEPSVLSAGSTWTPETQFKPVPSPRYISVAVPNFETRAWLRPRIDASATTTVAEQVEKQKPPATVPPNNPAPGTEFRPVPSDGLPNEIEECAFTELRSSFRKALTAKPKAEQELGSVKGTYAWQDLFRWVLVGAIVCFGISAVAVGIRLYKDELATSTTYQTVRSFLLETFTPSNPAPLVVHNAPPSMSTRPLHLNKGLKTSRIRVTESTPANKPTPSNKYEVLDAKTGRRYFPHTGTNVAVKFERAQAPPANIIVKLFSGPQSDASGGKIGRASQRSSGELPVKEVIPEYPALALQRNVQGRVALSATITTDGSLRNVRIVGSPSILDAAALNAVKEWRYQAHNENGRPVEVETQIIVDFSITME